jgi:dihydrofolate synthase/folylpolyglutamate synthase
MIAGEKAGIIKANTPICISEKQAYTSGIFLEKATQNASPIIFATDEVEVVTQELTSKGMTIALTTKTWGAMTVESPYGGIYQINNIVGVIAWCEQLNQLGIIRLNPDKIDIGIRECREKTQLRGRWEVYQHNPWVVADTAHNESGLRYVLEHVLRFDPQNLSIVLGMVADKEINRVLSLFPKDANYIFTTAHNPRAMPAEKLQSLARLHELHGKISPNVNEAIHEAKQMGSDFILVTGSTYLVAEIEDSF